MTVLICVNQCLKNGIGRVQVLVPAGSWQGSLIKSGGKFALLGCTVVPGFEFDDFELGSREALLERYSGQRELILKLTR